MTTSAVPMKFTPPPEPKVDRTLINSLLAEQGDKDFKYLTHDNGGRSFLVLGIEKDVYVLMRAPGMYSEDIDAYTELVKKYSNVAQVFPGIPQDQYPEFLGNSVLLCLSEGHYAWIQDVVFEFDAATPIVKLFSYVGNSDVPYPIALSDESVFSFVDQCVIPRAHFGDFSNWLECYGTDLYDNAPREPFANVRVVQERLE